MADDRSEDNGMTIGTRMPDGSIYAGLSPDTNKPMYAMAADAPLRMDFNKAAGYAKGLDAHGHNDWRVPSRAELNVLIQNKDKGGLSGTFDKTQIAPACWYWSSTPDIVYTGWGQKASGGSKQQSRSFALSVRCVR